MATQIVFFQSTMHQCLLIDELAARIAEACAPGYRDASQKGKRPSLQTLCSLARTCRALHDPALDVIWYYQLGLQNLQSFVPAGLGRAHQLYTEAQRTAASSHLVRIFERHDNPPTTDLRYLLCGFVGRPKWRGRLVALRLLRQTRAQT